MNLITKYFVLYHGFDMEQTFTMPLFDFEITQIELEYFALILSWKNDDFINYTNINIIEIFLNEKIKLLLDTPKDLYRVQSMILNSLVQKDIKNDLRYLLECFSYLKMKGFLHLSDYEQLQLVFEKVLTKQTLHEVEEKGVTQDNFHELKEKLLSHIKELKNYLSDSRLNMLKNLEEEVLKDKFTIAITGIINSGKSTTLNALLGKEALGTSMIPETANLTVLNKSKEQKAQIFFWNKDEFNNLTSSISAPEELINQYITNERKQISVGVNDLNKFTSSTSQMSALVKYVELGSDLSLLNGDIQIVDTPGLDDPIILRETITKEFISSSDMLLHLMNISQSTTKKDIDFLTDAIVYQKVSNIVIVITRADGYSRLEIEEVITYTKQQLVENFKRIGKNSQIIFLIDNLKFFTISGLMALNYKLGKSDIAKKAGYDSLESTGIVMLENYLGELLHGVNNTKGLTKLITINHKLIGLIRSEIEEKKYFLSLLLKDKRQLEEEYKNLIQQNKQNTIFLEKLQWEIENIKIKLNNFVDELDSFLQTELQYLKNILQDRIFKDIEYSLEKDNTKPTSERMEIIIKTTINDAVVDIVRDYRFKYTQKFQQSYETLQKKLRNNLISIDNTEIINKVQTNMIIPSYDGFINKVIILLNKSNKKNLLNILESLRVLVQSDLDEVLNYITSNSKKQVLDLNQVFFLELDEHLNNIIIDINKKEKNIEDLIQKYNTYDQQKSKQNILEEIDYLEEALGSIE